MMKAENDPADPKPKLRFSLSEIHSDISSEHETKPKFAAKSILFSIRKTGTILRPCPSNPIASKKQR